MSSPNQANNSQGHAIVIGGSIAGLLAARVLTEHFAKVTIIERDHKTAKTEFRKGTPHARHAHILMGRGQAIMEDLFPGFIQDLRNHGGIPMNMGNDFTFYVRGAWCQPFTSAIVNTGASRPLLEAILYSRLENQPQIQILTGQEVLALRADSSGQRVTGVDLRGRGEGTQHETYLAADLVVDASGRDSHAPAWLASLGYSAPEEVSVNAFPGYTTRIYQRPANFTEWKGMYMMPMAPNGTRGGVILPMEGDRWQVTLIGMAKDYPPTDEAGFLEFARSLPSPRFYAAIKQAEPLTAPYGYRRAENRLRYYEKLPRYLEGLLVCGDAVYALNPVYGQGMTVAALGSLVLDECLKTQRQRKAAGDVTGLAKQFQKKLAGVIADPWQLATSQDFGWPVTEGGKQPDAITRLINRYFGRVLDVMPYNSTVTEAFFYMQNMLKPATSLFHPRIVWQVLRTKPCPGETVTTAPSLPHLDTSIATPQR